MWNRRQVVWGLLSIWPLAYIMFLVMVYLKLSNSSTRETVIPFASLVALHLLTFFLIPGLIFAYIRLIKSSVVVPAERRSLWIALLVLGNALTFPLFWYRLILHGS